LILLSAILCLAYGQLLPCITESCGAAGSGCAAPATSPCGICFSNLTSCITVSFGNNNALCTCFTTFTTCASALGAVCSPTLYGGFQACLSIAPNTTCCGKAPTSLAAVLCHQPTTFCNTTGTGLCTTVSKNGPCTSSEQCGDPSIDVFNPLFFGSGYICGGSGTCTYSPEFPPGAPCSANSDCFSSSCTNGACAGTASGGSCSVSENCDKGLFCSNSGTCTAQVAVGANCPTSDSCQFGASCDAGVCVAFATKANGASCVSTNECVLGNVCYLGTCVTPPPVKSCTNDSDCTGDNRYSGTCSCLFGTAYTCDVASPPDILSPCASQGNTLQSCVKSKGCDPRLLGINCCNNEFDCLGACVAKLAPGGSGSLCGNIVSCTNPTTTKSAAVSVEVSFLLAMVALLALLF